jgi:superoxide dismutase, Cu-Zn family
VNSIGAAGVGTRLGTVTFTDTAGGLLIMPKLSGLPPGQHGFHVHEKDDCGPGMNQGKPAAGFAAGGHYDPAHTKKHLGPLSTAGHRGDLPVLDVDAQGNATHPFTAPHLTVGEIRGRSVMFHAGGDNYSDSPKPLRGGTPDPEINEQPKPAEPNLRAKPVWTGPAGTFLLSKRWLSLGATVRSEP